MREREGGNENYNQDNVCLAIYSGDLNTNHLNIGNIWIPNFLKFGFQMVRYSNGQSMGFSYVLDRPFKYQTNTKGNKMASSIQMVGLSVFKWHLKTRPFWHPTSFWPFKYQIRFGIQIPTVQWPSENRTPEYRIHLNTGLFSVRNSNGST